MNCSCGDCLVKMHKAYKSAAYSDAAGHLLKVLTDRRIELNDIDRGALRRIVKVLEENGR